MAVDTSARNKEGPRMRRFAVLVALLVAVAVPALAVSAMAQTEPQRLALTASSDHCTGGLPVVDYTVTNLWPTGASVQIWWLADASVYDVVGTTKLGPAPDSAAGSFTLPFDFYATVTVYATATWPDGTQTTNASWAIPVADCAAAATTTTTIATSTTLVESTTTTEDPGGNGNGNGYGYGRPTTTTAPALG
jgi:hypothetical protein